MGKRSLSFWYCIDVERMVSGKKSITKCKYVSSRLRPLGDMGAEIAVSIWRRPATKKEKGHHIHGSVPTRPTSGPGAPGEDTRKCTVSRSGDAAE